MTSGAPAALTALNCIGAHATVTGYCSPTLGSLGLVVVQLLRYRTTMNDHAAKAGILTEPAPEALFVGFGDSSLDFELRAWVGRADVVASFRSALGIGIERALREAGVEIPFPQRDVMVRTAELAYEAPGSDAGSGSKVAGGGSQD